MTREQMLAALKEKLSTLKERVEADDAEAIKEAEETMAEIDKLERTKLNVKDFSRKTEEYMPFALWAMVCLILEVLLRLTLLRRIP